MGRDKPTPGQWTLTRDTESGTFTIRAKGENGAASFFATVGIDPDPFGKRSNLEAVRSAMVVTARKLLNVLTEAIDHFPGKVTDLTRAGIGEAAPEAVGPASGQQPLVEIDGPEESLSANELRMLIRERGWEEELAHWPEEAIPEQAETPLQRIERQVGEAKAWADPDGFDEEWPEYLEPEVSEAWKRMPEVEKLSHLVGAVNWSGVTAREMEAIFTREVDFSKITHSDLDAFYKDSPREDRLDAAEIIARRLFEKLNFDRVLAHIDQAGDYYEQIDNACGSTFDLLHAIWAETWPGAAAIADFGIDSTEHYEALCQPLCNGEIMPAVLDAARGYGQKLTQLARDAPSNPHKGIVFHTAWDELLERPRSDGLGLGEDNEPREASHPQQARDAAPAPREMDAKDQRVPSPSQIIADPSPYLPEPQPGHGNDRER